MLENENEEIIINGNICKSIVGSEDENGNYIFEVEASNENLDLQNQITLQSALLKSKEYFLSNGIISDDHLHKTRNPDGSVETHKDKIIGEPISIRTDGKSTFVKGILYKGVEAAKDYIKLLKNGSTRVKASIGGIMPKVRKNADGSETVTSFMWNDLALTCSPVNWTVGSAKFAKSLELLDFCKSLNAGNGSDSNTMEGGRVLQKEDVEKETVKIMDINEGKLEAEDEEEEIKKNSEEEIIKSCINCIKNGLIKSELDLENFLVGHGFDLDKARETSQDILFIGGNTMKKSNFSSTIDELLKSFSKEKDEKEENVENAKKVESEEKDDLFDDEDFESSDDDEKEVEKCGVKKSLDEDDLEFYDATDVLKSINESLDSLKIENENLRAELAEVKGNMIYVTKSFTDYLSTPNSRSTVVEKSISENKVNNLKKMPNKTDFDTFKTCIVKAARDGKIGPEKVQFYNNQFQKAMVGQKISPEVWDEICSIVKENR